MVLSQTPQSLLSVLCWFPTLQGSGTPGGDRRASVCGFQETEFLSLEEIFFSLPLDSREEYFCKFWEMAFIMEYKILINTEVQLFLIFDEIDR